jgi:AraC family L-rhamnose operon regulatory protein RhaS
MVRSRRDQPVEVTLPAAGVAVFESYHRPGFAMQSRCDPFAKLLYILAGAGQCRAGSASIGFTAGDVLLVPSQCPHELIDDPQRPVWLLAACVAPSQAMIGGGLDALLPRRCEGDPLFGQQVRQILRQMLDEQTRQPSGHQAMLQALARQLFVLASRQRAPARAAAARSSDAAAVVRRLLALPPARWASVGSIDEVAGQLGVSRRTFTDLVRRISGLSWAQQVRKRRIEHACQLLRMTDRSPTAIAFECGFEEVSTFYRCFGRAMECTPADYRRRR